MLLVTKDGNHRVPHDAVRYEFCDGAAIPIISPSSSFGIIYILLDNPITIHHNICLMMDTK